MIHEEFKANPPIPEGQAGQPQGQQAQFENKN